MLIKLFHDRFKGSSLKDEELKKDIAWLTEKDWSVEQIFFSINYTSKHFPKEMEQGLRECLEDNKKELLRYYSIAKAKRELEAIRESDGHYDQRNIFKGKDTPLWLRKSIDFDLFK